MAKKKVTLIYYDESASENPKIQKDNIGKLVLDKLSKVFSFSWPPIRINQTKNKEQGNVTRKQQKGTGNLPILWAVYRQRLPTKRNT
jgi:hypothetical protein